jgi:hypothetical protein
MQKRSKDGFVSVHLTDAQIRNAILNSLREAGYEAKSNTLRIYGQGERASQKLYTFQGNIDARRPSMAKSADPE